eukprot:2519430-Amphidinium_carterae.1
MAHLQNVKFSSWKGLARSGTVLFVRFHVGVVFVTALICVETSRKDADQLDPKPDAGEDSQ